MKRRILAVFILITLLMSTFDVSLPIKALADTPLSYPNYTSLNTSNKELLQDLVQGGVPLKNEVGQYLVINVYRKYGLRVYDNANTCASSYGFRDPIQKKDGSIEYRYLGYNMKGQIVTNDNYFNDGNLFVDPSTLLDNKWVSQIGMRDSWLNTDNVVKDAMHTTSFISEDMVGSQNPKNYTLGDVLKKTVGSNYSDSTRNQYTNYSFMLSPLTLSSNGSTKVVKKGANGYFYNTLTYERKGLEPRQSVTFYKDATLTQLITEYTIPVGQETATVYAKVSTNTSLQEVKLGGKESSFIKSVENFLKDESLGKITNFSQPSDLYGVKPIELKRANYTRNYKNFTISAKANVEPASVVINITKEINSSGTLKVKVDDPSGLGPDFDIVYDNEIVTDLSVQNDGKTITKDFTFDLKDKTYVPVGNSVKNYNYFIYNHVKGDYDYFGYTKDSQFTLKVEKVSEYISNDTLTFKQLVVDVANKPYTMEHTVSIINKEDALMPPKAYIFPPGTVRAGERARITGKGESGTGSIVSYDFDLSSSFFIMSAKPQEKNGTFLNYDTAETSSLTVTDSSGLKGTASESTNVEHPIIPVMKTNGVYKVNRTIELDSTESRGTEFYPIDYVTWTIKPLEGQSLESIKLHEGGSVVGDTKKIVGDRPKVDFRQLGRYAVWMDVHATCTYAGQTHRTAVKQVYGVIHIKPDEPPIAMLSVPSKVIRESDPTLLKRAYFDIWDMSYSPDGDSIGKRRYFYRFDSDNDKSLTDETWTLLYEGTENHYSFNTPQVGNFEFRVEVEEANDSIASLFWNPDTDTLRANTDGQGAEAKTTEVINVAPITSVLADRRKLDLIVATDYEGSDVSTLKSNLDLLVKDLYEQGIDIQYKLVNEMEKSGSVNAPIYKYTRYGDLSYNVTFAIDNGKQKPTPYTQVDRKEWESRNLFEEDYKPNYGSEIPTTIQYNKGVNESGDGYTSIATKGTINAPEDPYKKNDTFYITEVFGNGLSAFQYVFDTIKFTLRGYFEKGGITSFGNRDLYTIRLTSIMAQPLREGADKKLLFVTKNSNAVSNLNEDFKTWVKDNGIAVSTVTGGSVFDKYGMGNGNIKNIALNLDSLVFRTTMNKDYKVGETIGYMKDVYPVETSPTTYSSKAVEAVPYNKEQNIEKASEGFYKATPTRATPIYTQVGSDYIFIENGTAYLGAEAIMTGAKYVAVVPGEYAWIVVGNGQSIMLSYNYSYYESYSSYYGRDIVSESRTIERTPFQGEPIINESYTVTTNYYKNHVYYDYDDDYYRQIRRGVYFKTTLGQVKLLKIRGYYDDFYIGQKWNSSSGKYYDQIFPQKSLGYSLFTEANEGDVGVFSIRDRESDPYRQVVILRSGNNIFSTYGKLHSHTTPSYQSYSTTPSKAQKLIVTFENGSIRDAVYLTENGSVLAKGNSLGGKFGTSDNLNTWANPIKESRQIVNNSPISLQDLLNLNPLSKAYASFTDFKIGIVNQYSSTAYEAILTRLLGDTLDQQVMYADYENDPMNQSAITLSHDPTALENPLGTDDDNGKTLASWDGLLDKTGLYTLHPKVQDSPSDDDRFTDYRLWNKDDMTLKVLVHRKPLAKLKLAMSAHAIEETKLVLTAKDNGSLDLDHQSEAQKGITEVQWGFKGIGDSTWQITNGSLGTQISKDMIRGETYQVSYSVKDKEGQWSDPVVKEITAGAKLILDAKLKPKESSHSLSAVPSGGTLTLYDVWTSYELPHYLEVQLFDGASPMGSLKRIDKNVQNTTMEDFPEVYWKDIDFTLPENLSEKAYSLRIAARDMVNPQLSQMKQFQISIRNNRPPRIDIQSILPQPLYWGHEPSVKLKVSDPDQDKLEVKVYYQIEGDSKKLLLSRSQVESGTVLDVSLPKLTKGTELTVFGEATDPAGERDQQARTWPVEPLGIRAVSVKGAWQHWRGQINGFGKQMTNEPYRFLSLERMTVEVETLGSPDELQLRLSPELESMTYKSPKGKIYSYKTLIGKEVTFPIIFKATNSNKYKIDYILPLAPSTLSWEDKRLRPAYRLEITLIKNGQAFKTIYGDEPEEPYIDLTGNTFDLLYNQPGAK